MTQIARIKDFENQMRKLHLQGGRPESIVRRVKEIVGAATMNSASGLSDYRLTNYGESRIRHCKKYDLGGGYRLVTVETNCLIIFCFVGNHEDVDRWLDRHRGIEFTADASGNVEYVHKSIDIEIPQSRIVTDTDYAKGSLFERISQEKLDELTTGIPASIIRTLLQLNTTA